MKYDDQPYIEEPKIEVGATIWADAYGFDVGKVVNIMGDRVKVRFENRVSDYPMSGIRCEFIPPFLVLVAIKKFENIITYHIKMD